MSKTQEYRKRLAAVECYLVGNDEWFRGIEATLEAARAWLSISLYEYVETLLKIMEEEVKVFQEQLDGTTLFDAYGYHKLIEKNQERNRDGA